MEKLRHKEEARKEKEAARIKAANERALAKRLAKDVTDLIDDEQLELMEAATAAAALNHDYLDGDGTLDASQSGWISFFHQVCLLAFSFLWETNFSFKCVLCWGQRSTYFSHHFAWYWWELKITTGLICVQYCWGRSHLQQSRWSHFSLSIPG